MNLGRIQRKVAIYIKRELFFLGIEKNDLLDLKQNVQDIERTLLFAKGKEADALLKHLKKEANKKGKIAILLEYKLEKIGGRINKLVNNEEALEPAERKELEGFRAYIEACRNKIKRVLKKGGELDCLVESLMEGQDWGSQEGIKRSLKSIQLKIDEVMGTANTPGITSLILAFEGLSRIKAKIITPSNAGELFYSTILEIAERNKDVLVHCTRTDYSQDKRRKYGLYIAPGRELWTSINNAAYSRSEMGIYCIPFSDCIKFCLAENILIELILPDRKSKINAVNFTDVLRIYGADEFRIWMNRNFKSKPRASWNAALYIASGSSLIHPVVELCFKSRYKELKKHYEENGLNAGLIFQFTSHEKILGSKSKREKIISIWKKYK
ncbi:hypothetical protein JW707_01310 [Candidatus Woesearchaeota archaeon]|nr:hypothetical protein [Candidatus Woesearchaeota archaeon]